MPNIFVLVGLPGCGKTTYINNVLKVEFPEIQVYDDIEGPHALPDFLEHDTVFSSPHFCTSWKNVLQILHEKYGDGHKIVPIFFENKPDECIKRVQNRNDNRTISESFILHLSSRFEIDQNEKIIKITD